MSMTPEGNIVAAQVSWLLMAWIAAIALAINLPLGYLRAGERKFSPAWFLYVHLSVPVIAYLRITNHVSAWAIPPFIGCALLGQIAGGWMHRSRHKKT